MLRSGVVGCTKCETCSTKFLNASRTRSTISCVEIMNAGAEFRRNLSTKISHGLSSGTTRKLPNAYAMRSIACSPTTPSRNPHWRHLRTTNIIESNIESNFDAVRSRTDVCKGLRSGTSATYLVYALLFRRKSRWRRFNGYQSLHEVHHQMTTRPLAIKKAASDHSLNLRDTAFTFTRRSARPPAAFRSAQCIRGYIYG